MKKLDINKLGFKIASIEIVSVNIAEPVAITNSETLFHFDINIDNKTNDENQLVIIVPEVKIRINDITKPVASIKIAIGFNINGYAEFIEKLNNDYKEAQSIMGQLHIISISTIRGVMFSELKGTYLHNSILPLIDSKSILANIKAN